MTGSGRKRSLIVVRLPTRWDTSPVGNESRAGREKTFAKSDNYSRQLSHFESDSCRQA